MTFVCVFVWPLFGSAVVCCTDKNSDNDMVNADTDDNDSGNDNKDAANHGNDSDTDICNDNNDDDYHWQ